MSDKVGTPKIVLVNMPFSIIQTPSLGAGLLKASLHDAGIGCEVLYLNLRFARRLGMELHDELTWFPSHLLVGEWLFAEQLWGENPERDAAYRDLVCDFNRNNSQARHDDQAVRQMLQDGRQHANEFVSEIINDVDWTAFPVVGFSSRFQQQIASLALARRIKRDHPDHFVIFGGPNCEAEMGDAMLQGFDFVDAICNGEGDLNFTPFIQQWLEGDRQPVVPGIKLRTKNDVANQSTGQCRVRDLDALPLPDFDDYFRELDSAPWRESMKVAIPFEASRGCWWGEKHHCTFCGLNGLGMDSRNKSADRVLDEIRFLLDRYGSYSNRLVAVDNILPHQYFKTLFPRLEDLDVDLFFEVKANLNQRNLATLQRAGVRIIQPGIESLSTPTLRLMRKGTTALQNVMLLRLCAEYDIIPYWNYLAGFPGESDEDYTQAADLIDAIPHLWPPNAGEIIEVRFDRFSPYFSTPGEFGLSDLRPYPAYHLVYDGLEDELIADLAYFFEARRPEPVIEAASKDRLSGAIQDWKQRHRSMALFEVETPDAIFIFDTREKPDGQLLCVRKPWLEMYRLCKSISTRQRMLDTIDTRLFEDANQWIDDMVQRRLLASEGDRFVTLAVSLGQGYAPPAAAYENFEKLLTRSQTGNATAPQAVS